MKLITREAKAQEAAKNWKAQYSVGGAWFKDGRPREQIYHRLCKAENAAEVDAIIGNCSWTWITCEVCGAEVEKAVQFPTTFGDEYEIALCVNCIGALAKLAETE